MTYIVEMEEVGTAEEDVLASETPMGEDEGDMLATAGTERRGLVRDLVVPALAISAATVGSMAVASALRHGSPWPGILSTAGALGLAGRRPPKRFAPRAAVTSLALIVGGSLVLSQLERMVAPRVGGGLARRAAVTSLTAFAVDRFLLRGSFMPALDRVLGRAGRIAMYAMVGIADAVARRAAPRMRAA
jgi:hypothetical protein